MAQTMQVTKRKKASIDLDDSYTIERLSKYGFDGNTRDFGDFMRKIQAEFGSGNASNMLSNQSQGTFPHEALIKMFKTDFAKAQLKNNFKSDLPNNLGLEEKEVLAEKRYRALMSDLDGGYTTTEFKKNKETKQYEIKAFEPPQLNIKQKGYTSRYGTKVRPSVHSYSRWNPPAKRFIQVRKANGMGVKEITRQYNASKFGVENRHTDKGIRRQYYRL